MVRPALPLSCSRFTSATDRPVLPLFSSLISAIVNPDGSPATTEPLVLIGTPDAPLPLPKPDEEGAGRPSDAVQPFKTTLSPRASLTEGQAAETAEAKGEGQASAGPPTSDPVPPFSSSPKPHSQSAAPAGHDAPVPSSARGPPVEAKSPRSNPTPRAAPTPRDNATPRAPDKPKTGAEASPADVSTPPKAERGLSISTTDVQPFTRSSSIQSEGKGTPGSGLSPKAGIDLPLHSGMRSPSFKPEGKDARSPRQEGKGAAYAVLNYSHNTTNTSLRSSSIADDKPFAEPRP